MPDQPGLVVLFGSGETSASGRKVHDWLLSRLTPPIQMAVLETPAGFEPNSDWVAGQVADFVRHRLQNYSPQVTVVPARRRGTPFSPDDPAIVAPLLPVNSIFLGPGSPTYAVRQLQNSLTWHILQARHRLGTAIILASAATLAVSTYTIPIYEIYKVGEELHWRTGLDFFGPFGLSLVFVPHWNNTDGGQVLDTSRCYMGRARFEQLLALLPGPATIVGLDEHTALVIDLAGGICRVIGRSGITLLKNGQEQRFEHGQTLRLTELGPFRLPEPSTGLPAEVWQQVIQADQSPPPIPSPPEPPAEVVAMVKERQLARANRDWSAADTLRQKIAALGWQVLDTPTGPQLEPVLEN